MSKPIIPTLLLLLVVISGCSVDVTRGPRDTLATTLDVSPPLPACANCLQCPQSAGPQRTVLATRRHRLEIPAGPSTPRPVKFVEIEQDGFVGVHVQGVGQLPQPATLVLSYAGCPSSQRPYGVARLANIGSEWRALPGAVDVRDSSYVRVSITETSRFAVTTE